MLHLRAFGGLAIETEDRGAIAAARRRPLALLALLAMAGERGLSREKVVALLWPESDEEHGRNSLSQALAALRRDLAADDLVVASAELRLNPSVITSDAVEFERCIASGALERAVALYQGPFLDGFFVRDAADFERWAEEHRRRLHLMCAATLERLARAADERPDREGALAWWKQLAALEPTSAQAVSGLMRALATMGDRAGVQRQYRVHEALMRQDLGVAPEPAVSALATSLLTDRVVPVLGAEDRTADRSRSARELVQELDAIVSPKVGASTTVTRAGHRRSLTRHAAIAGAMVAVVALIGVGVVVARRAHGATTDPGNTAHRVVVRTFRNNSGDKTLDPIGLMAADWIARGLTETPSVDVAGTESEISAPDAAGPNALAMTPMTLGRLTRARYVISGSYHTQSDSLFLEAEVTDADAARRVLAIEPVGDAIQAKQAAIERLRQRVTGALVPFFDSSVVTESRVPPRLDAYEEFVLGDRLYDSDLRSSIAHLRAAARLDSTFVWARLRLISGLQSPRRTSAARDSVIAEVEAMRGSLNPFEAAAFDLRIGIARRNFHDAYVASQNALRLAPKSSWAGFEAGEAALIDGRPHEAVRLFEALDPEAGALRWYRGYYGLLCRAYHDVDRFADMRRCYERARSQYPRAGSAFLLYVPGATGDVDAVDRLLDSVVATPNLSLVGTLFELEAHGHADGARAIARRALISTRRPNADSTAVNLLNTRMGLLMFLGEWHELARLADSTLKRGESPWAFAVGGVAAAMLGDTTEARRRVRTFVETTTLDGAFRHAVRILAAIGDKQAALDILRSMVAPAYVWQYHDDLIYRLMRGYAPFEDFLKPRD